MDTKILNIKLSFKPFMFIFLSCCFSINTINPPQIENFFKAHHISQENILIKFCKWITNIWKKQKPKVETENQNKILDSNESDKLEKRSSSNLQIENNNKIILNISELESSKNEIDGLTDEDTKISSLSSPSLLSPSLQSPYIENISSNDNSPTHRSNLQLNWTDSFKCILSSNCSSPTEIISTPTIKFDDHSFDEINTANAHNASEQIIVIEMSTQSELNQEEIEKSIHSILQKCCNSFPASFDNLKAYLIHQIKKASLHSFKLYMKYMWNKMQQDSSNQSCFSKCLSKCSYIIISSKLCISCTNKICSYEIGANAARSIILICLETILEDKPKSSFESYPSILEPMKNIKHQFYKENNTQLNFDQLKNQKNNKFFDDFYPQRQTNHNNTFKKITKLFNNRNADNKKKQKFSTKNAIIVIGAVSLAYAVYYFSSSKEKVDIII